MRFNPGWPIRKHERIIWPDGLLMTVAERDFVGALSLFRSLARWEMAERKRAHPLGMRSIRIPEVGKLIHIRATGKVK